MKKDLVKRVIRRKRIELFVALMGYLIGIGIGVWFIILMVMYGISK
jgi:ABC-type lipoprotein release transport system permease subunit